MNIWTGLLFLEGAITDTSLTRELAGDTAPDRPASAGDDEPAGRNVPPADRWLTGTGQY